MYDFISVFCSLLFLYFNFFKLKNESEIHAKIDMFFMPRVAYGASIHE